MSDNNKVRLEKVIKTVSRFIWLSSYVLDLKDDDDKF